MRAVQPSLALVEGVGACAPVRRLERDRPAVALPCQLLRPLKERRSRAAAAGILRHDEVGDPGLLCGEVESRPELHVAKPDHAAFVFGHQGDGVGALEIPQEQVAGPFLLWGSPDVRPPQVSQEGLHGGPVLRASLSHFDHRG